MPKLFNDNEILILPDSDVSYYPNFIDYTAANIYVEQIKKTTPWQQDDITVFVKTYPQPRLTALFITNNKPYSYSILQCIQAYSQKNCLKLKYRIEQTALVEFTTCLVNRYRTGSDSNGWHADNEKN